MRRLLKLAAVLLLFPCHLALAQQSQDFGEYVVHYNALNTNLITPQVAQAYGIRRSSSRALLNITVLKKDDVIILLDGDDWLTSSSVLSYLNEIYQEKTPLVTYGSYQYYPSGDVGVEPSEYSFDVIKNNKFREDVWRASHLRTFKYGVFKKLNTKDLKDVDGHFYKKAYDQAIMLPLLEIAGERSLFIPEILCVYNRANALNVDKFGQKEQYETMLRIRKRKKYEKQLFKH